MLKVITLFCVILWNVFLSESLLPWPALKINEKECFSLHVPWAVAAGELIGVTGGVKAKAREFRHMAALGWKKADGNGYEYHCGATLIAPTFILTAAHCRSYQGRAPNVALIGGAKLTDSEAMNEPVEIKSVIIHPNYKRKLVYHDIALMELASSSSQHIACLWPITYSKPSTGVVVGYGNTGYGQSGSDHLLKAKLQIVPNDECDRFYPTAFRLKEGIIDSQFCAGDRKKFRDTCPGDSGGPLLVYLKISNVTIPFVMGITSFGQGCGAGPPGVYTNVVSYLHWIESIVWPTSKFRNETEE